VIRRFLLLALAMNFALAVVPARAQQTNKPPVIGVLFVAAGAADPLFIALRQGLRELGYVEGRNIRFEFRTAHGLPDRLPRFAEELVELKVDVIVVGNSLAAQAVRHATSTVPIVIATGDPIAAGLVTSLAHPGGNVTGLSGMVTELSAKRLQLLKEMIPRLTRVAVLWSPDTPTQTQAKIADDLKAVSPSLSIELSFVSVRTREELAAAFSAINEAHAQGLYVPEDNVFYGQRTMLAALALKARIPAIYGSRAYAEEGGLMSYGVDYGDQFRRSAAYVDKILKGAKPGDLPIEQATKIELVVNLKTAKALGLTVPESVLYRADEVIR
jgi:putative tryptophan/tyrosine transport system substrate-binding protein